MLRELQLDFMKAMHAAGTEHQLPINVKPGLAPEDLIAIYRESSTQGLLNTLKNIFSTCRAVVSARFFEEICLKYICTHSSHSPDINDYGRDFAHYIAHSKTVKKWPYLSELAQLDWLCHLVSRAPMVSSQLDFALISNALENDQDILFELLPAMDLLETTYPLYELWQMHQPGYTGKGRVIFSGKKREYLIINRNPDNVCLYRVKQDLWMVIKAMKQGISLKNIITLFEQKGDNLDLSTILPAILQEKWVRCFQLI